MLFNQYLKTLNAILDMYGGEMPLHHFLKNYFRSNRQMGSRDRKMASRLAYAFYRMGKALPDLPAEERLAIAMFLTETESDAMKEYMITSHTTLPVEKSGSFLDEKISLVTDHYREFNLNDLFPFTGLSKGVDELQFRKSMLVQPAVWLRLKDKEAVISNLLSEGVSYVQDGNALMVEPGVDLNRSGISENRYEIQDRSSQLTGRYFLPKSGENWFDCCAASGGKSLLLHSIEPGVNITVNDVRSSSLSNLALRFKRNKISVYKTFNADLASGLPVELSDLKFDGIIADVPCSGSGTWARTPEQVSFFDRKKTLKFTTLQWSIMKNVSALTARGKPLIYITCSVFKEENEDMTERICRELGFRIEKQELITGYEKRADTLFVSRMIRLPQVNASRTA